MAKVKPLPKGADQFLRGYIRGQNFRNQNPVSGSRATGSRMFTTPSKYSKSSYSSYEDRQRANAARVSGALGKVGDAGKDTGFSWSKLGKSALFGVLDVVDTSRAAVVSGARETTDLLVDVFNMPGHEYNDASIRDWLKATRDNKSFAEHLKELKDAERKSTGTGTENDLFGFVDIDNPWVLAGTGFATDVAADPITYLTGGGSILSKLSKADLGALFVQHGLPDIAVKARRVGAANLTQAELGQLVNKMAAAGDARAAGMGAGLHIRKPGTGWVGRNTLGRLPLGRFSRRFVETADDVVALPRWLGGAGNRTFVGGVVARGASRVAGNLGRTNAVQNFLDYAGGSRRPLKRVLATTTDPEQFRQAQIGLDAMNQGDLIARKVTGALEVRLKALLNKAKQAGVDGETLYHAVGSADSADDFLRIEEAAPGLVAEFRKFFEDARNMAHSESGLEFLGNAEFYVPRYRSESLAEATGTASKMKGPVSSIEKGRTLKAGAEWLGQKLVAAADHPQGWSIEQQVEARAREVFGAGNEVFNENMFEVAERYVMQLGRRTGDKFVEKRLLDEGVAKSLWKTVVDADDGPLRRARAVAAQRHARAEGARRAADRAARRAGRAQTEVTDLKARQAAQEAGQASRVRQAAGAADDAAGGLETASPEVLSKAGKVAQQATTSLDTAIAQMATAAARLAESGAATVGKADDLAAARAALRDAERAAHQLGRRKAALIASRDEVWDKLARSYERIGSQSELKATVDELIDLEAKLADLRIGMAEAGVDAAKAAEQVAKIDEALAPMLDQVRKLEAFIKQAASGAVDSPAMRNARKQAQDKLKELDEQLRTGWQARQAALKQAQAAAPDLSIDLEDAQQHLASLYELAETLGNDAMRQRLTAIARTIPQPTGEGLAHPGGTVWHAANGKRSVNTADGLLDGMGQRFVSSNGRAAAQAEVLSENPVVYFPGQDAVWQAKANGEAVVSPALADVAEGADMAPRVVADMLDLAARRGLINVNDFLPDSREHWQALLDAYDGTIPLERLADDIIGPNAREALFAEASSMPARTQQKVREAFARHLAAQGHDAITYWDGATWVVQPLEAAAVNIVGGNRVDALRGVNDALEAAIAKAHDHTREALDVAQRLDRQYGLRIDRLTLDEGTALKTAAEQRARIAALEREAADLLTSGASTQTVEKIDAEIAFRQKAQFLFEQAEGFRQQAAQVRQQAFATVRDAGVQAVDGDAIGEAIAEAEAFAQVARLEAQAAAAEASQAAGRASRAAARLEALSGKPETVRQVRAAMERGWKELGANSMAPDFIVDSLYEMTRLSTDTPKVLKAYDKALNWFKAWAVATPGFVSRNLMGGVFTNYLAGVEDPGMYRKFVRAMRGKGDQQTLDLVEQIRQAGILSGGQSTFEGAGSSAGRVREQLRNMGPVQGLNPLQPSNYVTTAISGASGHVEDFLRGTLALQILEQGGTMDDAIRSVFKYHFNYDDLSRFERDIARRVVPFYTWTRKALPLMIEMAVKQPKGFARYTQAKNNLEATVDQEFHASWIDDSLGIRLPVGGSDGGMYVLPDLPMKTLGMATDPVELGLSGMVPFLKTPLESMMGRKLFNDAPLTDDYGPVPEAWRKVPGLVQGLQALGWVAGGVERGRDGQLMITDRRAYQVESMVPLLSRARRMLPSEERYQQRATSTWFSTMTGVATRKNTLSDQWNETFSRLDNVDRQLDERAQLSGVPRPPDMPMQAYYELIDPNLAEQRQLLLDAQDELELLGDE